MPIDRKQNEAPTETLASLLSACDRVNEFIEDKLQINVRNTNPIDIEVSIQKTKGMSGYSLMSMILKNDVLFDITSYGEKLTTNLNSTDSIEEFTETLTTYIEMENSNKGLKVIK